MKLILLNIIFSVLIFSVVKHLHCKVLLIFSEGVTKKILSYLMFTLLFHSIIFLTCSCYPHVP